MAGKPKYETAEKLESAIDSYFKDAHEKKKAPSISGMALALGFKSRKPLMSYMHRGEEFSTIIELSFNRIEKYKIRQWLSADTITQEIGIELTKVNRN